MPRARERGDKMKPSKNLIEQVLNTLNYDEENKIAISEGFNSIEEKLKTFPINQLKEMAKFNI